MEVLAANTMNSYGIVAIGAERSGVGAHHESARTMAF